MMGMRFMDMDVSDSLDVVHVLLEEDSVVLDDRRSDVRSIMYNSMYKGTTAYGRARASVSPPDHDPESGSPPGTRTRTGATKPYIPPTPENELAGMLGGPLE